MGVEIGGPRRPYSSKWMNVLLLVGMAVGLVVAFAIGQSKVGDPYRSPEGVEQSP